MRERRKVTNANKQTIILYFTDDIYILQNTYLYWPGNQVLYRLIFRQQCVQLMYKPFQIVI